MIERSNRIPSEQVDLICRGFGITHSEFDRVFDENLPADEFELTVDNMILSIDEPYAESCDKKFGISMALVRKTIKEPDAHQDLFTPNGSIRYYVKKIPGTEDYLLVEVSGIDDDVSVTFAFRIIKQIADKAASIEPEHLLKVLADDFGNPLEIGGTVPKKFFWKEDIVAQKDELLSILGAEPPKRYYGMIQIAGKTEAGRTDIRVDVGYLIELDKYEASLK